MARHAVIMAGGVGSRFWPLSRNQKPKQFLDILGTGKSLLQQTVDRLSTLVSMQNIWIVTHENYRNLVIQQCPAISLTNILSEPFRRNTAPCVAFALTSIHQQDEDASMLFAPADHIILDEDKFVEDCNVGFDFIENNCALLTFGIQATIPHTGYGYIEYNESVSDPFEKDNIFPVLNFVEKPDHNTALKYLHQGNYVWNSGIFLWHMKTISEEFQAYLPGWLEEFNKENIHNNIRKIYESIQSISIDYAILEKSKRIFVKKVNFGWSDLGSWGSLYDHLPQNEDSNAMIGNGILAMQTNDCLIQNTEKKLLAIYGLRNMIVVNTDTVLMICDKNEEQNIKKLLKEVEDKSGDKFS